MKLRQQPEDFRVEELTDLVPGREGDQALYQLQKRGRTTPDALNIVRTRWKLDPGRISFGGLKDRHALTSQFFTIRHGPPRGLNHPGVHVRYLGQVSEPFRSGHIRANRFRIVVRHVKPADMPALMDAVAEVRRDGLPNYFDDQRFGSVPAGGGFVARDLVQGRFEDALRMALTSPYEFDRSVHKRIKAILRENWGDWPAIQKRLPRGRLPSALSHLLRRPGDFRGAVARLQPEMQGLYLAVYQSHLWNRMLARWLRENCRPGRLLLHVPLRLGPVPFPRGLASPLQEALAKLKLPLPSARWRPEPADPRLPLVNSVLAEEGLELRRLRVPGMRNLFFSKGERAALVVPAGLEAVSGRDELNPGRQRLVLNFDLPRGAYATLVVKRCCAAIAGAEEPVARHAASLGGGDAEDD